MSVKIASIVVLAAVSAGASAQIVTLTPDQINGLDTNTASFNNGDVEMIPLVGNTPSTFNAGGARLGIDGQGTNNNAFNDPDTIANNGNEEKLQMTFAETAGLTQISWDFSRAELIEITGFSADPGASFSGRNFDPNGVFPDLSATYDSMTGTLAFALPFNIGFGPDLGFLDLANADASAGETLTLMVTDTNNPGGQLAIRSISYDSAVPAPASLAALLGFGVVGTRRSRR